MLFFFSYINLDLPTFVLPSGVLQHIFLDIFILSIAINAFSPRNLLLLTFATRLWDIFKSLSTVSLRELTTNIAFRFPFVKLTHGLQDCALLVCTHPLTAEWLPPRRREARFGVP
jgi:hypothetical protein